MFVGKPFSDLHNVWEMAEREGTDFINQRMSDGTQDFDRFSTF